MGVNYGLGGFKDGLAYISVYLDSPSVINIESQDKVFSMGSSLTTLENFICEVDVTPNIINVISEGTYLITWNATTSGATNDVLKLNVGHKNNSATEFDILQGVQTFNSKAGDFWTTSSCLLYEFKDLAAGHMDLGFWAQNTSSSENITINQLNINLIKLDGTLNVFADPAKSREFLAGTAFGNLYSRATGSRGYDAIDTWYDLNTALDATLLVQTSTDELSLEIEQSGYYYIYVSISTSGSANDDLTIGLFINSIIKNKLRQSFNSKGGSEYQSGYSVIVLLQAGDEISPAIQNNTDTSGNTTFENINMIASRIGNI